LNTNFIHFNLINNSHEHFFSQNLRFLRSKMSEKTSQEKLAELLKIKKPTLGSYESGRAEPKYADLIALAEFSK